MDIIELEEVVEQLNVGNATHTICPFCNAKHERSFRIAHYRDGTIYGKCYRAKCTGKHTFKRGTLLLRPEKVKSKFNPRNFADLHLLEAVPEIVAFSANKKYTLTASELRREGVLWDSARSLMYFPTYDINGCLFGGMTKDFYHKQDKYPKWVTYFNKRTTKLHYPQSFVFDSHYCNCVIVEDIISAIRLSRYMKAVAILGTELNDEQALELSTICDKLYVALDPDANDKAMKIKKRYNSLFAEGIKVALLDCDPKDYKDDEQLIKTIIGLPNEGRETPEGVGEEQKEVYTGIRTI